jgi:hypothetical protein
VSVAPSEKISQSKDGTIKIYDSAFAPQGTSYSGADIKLVVHVYDKDRSSKRRKEELSQDYLSTSAASTSLLSSLKETEAKLSLVKQGTPEFQILSTRRNKIQSQLNYMDKVMDDLSTKQARLGDGKDDFSTKELADVQTISISVHRIKTPVRAFGKVYPSGYCRGQRTIAGSIIFTVFQEHVLYDLMDAHPSDFDSTAYTTALLDQIPPMDITIVFANEYGQLSRMALYGVEFVTEGQTMSIEDILTENAVNYVARDFDPLRGVGKRKLDAASAAIAEWTGMKASDLIREDEYQNVKNTLDPFSRSRRRQNPFI